MPIPPNPVKMKKMLAQTNETKEGSDKKKKNNRPDIDSNKSKWYMGLYGGKQGRMSCMVRVFSMTSSLLYDEAAGLCTSHQLLLSMEHHEWVSISAQSQSGAFF